MYNEIMLVVLHVVIALLSLIYATFAYISPSQTKLRVMYASTALTILSGLFLVIDNPGHMLQSCLMGVLYLGGMTFGIVSTKRKLAKATA